MNKPGLIISLVMFFAWLKNSSKPEQQPAEELDLPDLDNFGIDYNSTPMPDGLKIKTTLRVVSIDKKKHKCTAKVYLYLSRERNNGKPIYIHDIVVNVSLFDKYFYYWNKWEDGGDFDYCDYAITWKPSRALAYSPYGRMFGAGTVELTDDELQQIKDAIADGQKSIQPFAKVDVLIKWSDKERGDVDAPASDQWINGVARGIVSTLMAD